MTQIAATDNNFVARIAGSDAFLPTAGDTAATGAKMVISLVAIIKEKRTALIRYGLLGALSIATTSTTMWLVGISMNYAFNL